MQRFLFLFFAMLALCSGPALSQDARPQGLVIAAQAMEKYLQTLDGTKQAEWKSHFNWESWGPTLVRDESLSTETAEAILPKFYGFHDGLDQAEFLRMRAELKSYLQGTDPPSPVGTCPSFYVRMSKEFVDARLKKQSRSLDLQRETANDIAGAWVTGVAETNVQAQAKLAEFHEQAAIEIRIRGVVRTPHTVATARRFHVHGSSNSQFEGVAHLLLDQDGFHATQPQITAQTQSELDYVDGPRPLRRIAMRQAQKRQGQGEMEGAEIIRATVEQEFKAELAKEIAELNSKFAAYEKFWVMLKRADVAPTKVETKLQQNSLELGLRFTDSGADTQYTGGPRPDDASLELVMHETFLGAFPRRFLKGVWWKAEDFARVQKQLAGIPLDPNEKPELEAWSARWDSREPITIHVTPEVIDCRLAFSHAGIGDQWVKEGILVDAKFTPAVVGAHLVLRRIDRLSISPRSPNIVLSADEEAFFTRKFTELCGESIALENLHPPAGLSVGALALFTTTNVTLEPGWLNLRFRNDDGPLAKLVKSK